MFFAGFDFVAIRVVDANRCGFHDSLRHVDVSFQFIRISSYKWPYFLCSALQAIKTRDKSVQEAVRQTENARDQKRSVVFSFLLSMYPGWRS